MNKKAIILIVIFALLLGVGGVFLLLEREDNVLIEEIKFEPAKNYVIKDTPEGKIVENKNAGLSFKVPEGWRAEVREYDEGGGTVEIFTPNIIFFPNSKLQESGCGLSVTIKKSEETSQSIQNLIKDTQENPGVYQYREIIEVSDHKALKQLIFSKEDMGYGFSVQIPITDRIYILSTFFPKKEKETCETEFDRFLETVSIK